MDELALVAAGALMTAIATDAWGEVRTGAVNLWRRVYPERVPAIESELADVRNEVVAARQAGDAEAGKELATDWARKFQRLMQAHPELVPDLRLLGQEWARVTLRAGPDSSVANVQQTAIATRRGTVYQAGRNQRITNI